MAVCSSCGTEVEVGVNNFVARSASCPACNADLHSCIQCEFYDPGSYNECRDPQAERVVEKERSNFCDYFRFSSRAGSVDKSVEAARKKLDDLFK